MSEIKDLQNIMPVILTGGKSSRMGQNKAFAIIGTKPLLAIAGEKLSGWFGTPPLLVTNTPDIYAKFAYPTAQDIIPEMGPLGGIYTALRLSDKPCIFAAACDMPFLNKELLIYMAAMAAEYDSIVPCYKERLEPLHAIYSVNCLPVVEKYLKRGEKKITALFPELHTYYLSEKEIKQFSPDMRSFINVNTPAQLAFAKSIWARELERV